MCFPVGSWIWRSARERVSHVSRGGGEGRLLRNGGRSGKERWSGNTNPEVNVQRAAVRAGLPVAHLEGDGHLVVLVQLLVEAFPRVRAQVDVVGQRERKQGQQGREEEGEGEHPGTNGSKLRLRGGRGRDDEKLKAGSVGVR